MQTRNIYLQNNKTMALDIFEGHSNFNNLTTFLISYNMKLEDCYIIKFANMLYAFFYNDWNELIVGRDELYYINSDSHFCKRIIHNGKFDWPYSDEEVEGRCIPDIKVFGIFDDLYRIDKSIAIYYFDDNKWNIMDINHDSLDFKKIICEFGKQFYRSFFFSRVEIHMYLPKYFDKKFLAILDQFYANGAFRVNPFTWKTTLDVTDNATYCAFYDNITRKPICEFGGKFFNLNNIIY